MPALQPAAAHAPVHAAHFARLAAAYTAELTPATQADLDEAWGLLEPPVEEEESLPAGTAPPPRSTGQPCAARCEPPSPPPCPFASATTPPDAG